MNKCPICGGEMHEDIITHPQEYEGRVILIENVPVWVCGQCGEVLVVPEVLEKIQRVAWSDSKPERTTEVPVYDLAKAI